jgi:hypothetical protein
LFQSPYSPDLNILDRFIFRGLKEKIGGIRFNNKDELEVELKNLMKKLDKDFLKNQVVKLTEHCQNIIDCEGEYVV